MKALSQRPIIVAMTAVAIVVALLVVRSASEARVELAVAQAHQQRGEILHAIEHYRRALRWHFPLSPYTSRAAAGLEACAAESEAAANVSTALLAWRSLLGGLSATRSVFARHRLARRRASEQIARLEALDADELSEAGLRAGRRRTERALPSDLEASPDPPWAALLVLGFATWLVSLVWLTRRGFDRTGRLQWDSARAPIWSALVGLLAFLFGLSFA